MIKLKFRNKDKEIEFFKKISYLNIVEDVGIKFAEMVNVLDIAESDKEDE